MNIQNCAPAVLRFEQTDVCASRMENFRLTMESALLGEPKLVVVDLSEVSFVFSGVISTLIRIKRSLFNCGAQMIIVAGNDKIDFFLKKAGLDRLFTIVPDLDSVLRP